MANIDKVLDGNPIDKATEGDKKAILSESLRNFHKEDMYPYLIDYDDQYVYFEVWDDGEYVNYRDSYDFNGTSATFGDSLVKVVRTTNYETVEDQTSEEDLDRSIGDKVTEFLRKHFGGSGSRGNKLPVIKQFDQEQMISIEPLYVAIDDVDAVGDTYYDAETCYQMVESLNKSLKDGILKSNYFHKVMTDDFTVVKAWVNECDCMIGDNLVREGLPLVKLQFNNETAWELRKSGELMGVSIGAKAEIIEVDDE